MAKEKETLHDPCQQDAHMAFAYYEVDQTVTAVGVGVTGREGGECGRDSSRSA